MNKNIGCIGQGFVGSAVSTKLSKEGFSVFAYDKDSSRSHISNQPDSSDPVKPINIAMLVEECDVIFICVPTPMFEDGECDTRIVESVLDDVAREAEFQNKHIIAILKSTVPPGTTQRLNGLSNKLGVIFSPEFLTEANATNDFDNQTRIILGIDYIEYIDPVRSIFVRSFPNADIIIINSKEAEMTKYTTNLFLATKVSFFNDIYTLCDNLGINYDNVIEATIHDPRIGKSHYNVPGPDGDRGYGGHCFPGIYEVTTPSTTKTLEQLYDDINSGGLPSILSTNSNVDTIEYKDVLNVTKNKFKGDLLKFTLDNGSVIECTPEHLFPISRNGELILSKACDIINTDEFYTKLEINNKKTLTVDDNPILR